VKAPPALPSLMAAARTEGVEFWNVPYWVYTGVEPEAHPNWDPPKEEELKELIVCFKK
jgi:hypothetical protein